MVAATAATKSAMSSSLPSLSCSSNDADTNRQSSTSINSSAYVRVVQDNTLLACHSALHQSSLPMAATARDRARELEHLLAAVGADLGASPETFSQKWEYVLRGLSCAVDALTAASTRKQIAAAVGKSTLRPNLLLLLRELCACGQAHVPARALRLAVAQMLRDFLSIDGTARRLRASVASTPTASSQTSIHEAEQSAVRSVAIGWAKYTAFSKLLCRLFSAWGDQFAVQPFTAQLLVEGDYSLSATAVRCWITEVFGRAHEESLARCILLWLDNTRRIEEAGDLERASTDRARKEHEQPFEGWEARSVLDMLRVMGAPQHGDFYRFTNALEASSNTRKQERLAQLLPLRLEQRKAPTRRTHTDTRLSVEGENSPYGRFEKTLVRSVELEFVIHRDELLRLTPAAAQSRTKGNTTSQDICDDAQPKIDLAVYMARVGDFSQREQDRIVRQLGVSPETWKRLHRTLVQTFVLSLQIERHPIMTRWHSQPGASTSPGDQPLNPDEHTGDAAVVKDKDAIKGAAHLLEEGTTLLRPIFVQLNEVQILLDDSLCDCSNTPDSTVTGYRNNGSEFLVPSSESHLIGIAPLVKVFSSYCESQCVDIVKQAFSRPWPQTDFHLHGWNGEAQALLPAVKNECIDLSLHSDRIKDTMVAGLLAQHGRLSKIVADAFKERPTPFQHALDLAIDRAINYTRSQTTSTSSPRPRSRSLSLASEQQSLRPRSRVGSSGEDRSDGEEFAVILAHYVHDLIVRWVMSKDTTTNDFRENSAHGMLSTCNAIANLAKFLGNPGLLQITLEKNLQERLLYGNRSALVQGVETQFLTQLSDDYGVLFSLKMRRMLYDERVSQQELGSVFAACFAQVESSVRPKSVSNVQVLSHSAWSLLSSDVDLGVMSCHPSRHLDSNRLQRGFDFDTADGLDLFQLNELRCLPLRIRTIGAIAKRRYHELFPERILRVHVGATRVTLAANFPSGSYKFRVSGFQATVLQTFRKGQQSVGLTLRDFAKELGLDTNSHGWSFGNSFGNAGSRSAQAILRSTLDVFTFRGYIPVGCQDDKPLVVVSTRPSIPVSRPGTPKTPSSSRPGTASSSRPGTAGSRPGTANSRPGTAAGSHNSGTETVYKLNRKFVCRAEVVVFPPPILVGAGLL